MDKELERTFNDGAMVKETIESPGWTKIVAPALEKRKESLFAQLATAKTYREMVVIQQAVNAINILQSFITATLVLGEDALEKHSAEHPEGLG